VVTMRLDHWTGVRLYECKEEQCSEQFLSKQARNGHMRTHK